MIMMSMMMMYMCVSVMKCEKCASDQTMQIAYGISIIYIRHAAIKGETSVYGHDKRNRK